MSDPDPIIVRIDQLQADMELRFAQVNERIGRISDVLAGVAGSMATIATLFAQHLREDHHRGTT